MTWFVWQDEKRVGPLTEAELRALVESGAITERHAVCRQGSAKWTPLGLVPELASPRPELVEGRTFGWSDSHTAANPVLTGSWRLRASAVWIVIVLGVFLTGALIVMQGGPAIWEFAVMLADHDPAHHYQLRLLPDASELEVSGFITFGLTDGVRAQLDAHPDVKFLLLNSSGGRVAEARKLRDLIAQRHLSTCTSRQCTSSCVIPFLAGERRLIAPGAIIGFHQYTVAGKASRLTLLDMEKDKAYFTSRGVSSEFVSRAFLPTSDLWRPDPEQMLAAGFITGYADDDATPLSGMAPGEIDRLDETLRHDPVYAALAEFEPEAYAAIVAAVKEGFRHGQTLADLRSRTAPIIEQVYGKRLAFASDEAAVAFARLKFDKLTILEEDPDSCLAYLSPGTNRGRAVPALISTQMQNRERDVMIAVIQSGASGQWRPPDQAEVAPIREEITARMLATFTRDDVTELAHLDRPGANAPRACEVSRGLYKVIVDLPAAKAGSIVRDMFARTAAR